MSVFSVNNNVNIAGTAPMGGITLRMFRSTLSITAISLLLAVASLWLPVLEALSFDFYAITQSHEYWRLITSHFVHSSSSHLFWDLLTFCAANAYLEYRNRSAMHLGLMISLIAISAFLMTPFASVNNYAGLSGIVYAQITIAGLYWARDNAGLLGWIPILGIIIKTLLELNSGDAVFMSQGWHVYDPAHIIGLVTGVTIFLAKHVRLNCGVTSLEHCK